MARELFPNTLEYSPNRLATGKGGACVRLGASRGMPTNLVPRTVGSVPNPRTFGNCREVVLAGTAYRVFRFTLQGLNQSFVGLSPLSETT
jgi:hypothetical protein